MVSIINPCNASLFRNRATNWRVNQITTQIRKQLEAHEGHITPQICQEYGLKLFDEFCFKKLRQLGTGSFGEVWMCMRIENRDFVAVKYINVKKRKGEINIDNFASFLVEKEMLQKVFSKGTPSIAKLLGTFYKFDSKGNIKYAILVSESGDYSLDQLIQQRAAQSKPYQPQEVLRILCQLSEGYKSLQELRIYHSDTKLSNLVFSAKMAKFLIIDFGASKFVAQGGSNQHLDDVYLEEYATAGTEGWFSPEKAYYWDCCENGRDFPQDRKTFNPFKDDMWALGICLEKILEITTSTCIEDNLINHILKHLKSPDPKNRFDANQLFQFLVENNLKTPPLDSVLFQTEFEIATELDKKGREEVGFHESFNLLQSAFMPNEMLEVALEEHRSLVRKFGEPDLHNMVHFLGVLGRLGKAYRNTGNHIKALEYFKLKRETLENQYKTREQVEVADALFSEAFEIIKLGRSKEALGIYEEVLEIRRKLFKTEEHPEVLKTLQQIANQWLGMGFYQKALEQYKYVLELQKTVFKTEEHQSICITLSQIALLNGKIGDHHKALKECQHVLDIQKTIFTTEEHPEVCGILYQIAVQHYYIGQMSDALAGFEKVLANYRKIFKSDDHPDVQNVIKWINIIKNKKNNLNLFLKHTFLVLIAFCLFYLFFYVC